MFGFAVENRITPTPQRYSFLHQFAEGCKGFRFASHILRK